MLLLCLLTGFQQTIFAQDRNPVRNVIYPDGAFLRNGGRIIDITQPPYNATGDGVTDDTDAIVAAYNTVADSLRKYGWQFSDNIASYILYFPSGEYLVSNTLIHDGEINYDSTVQQTTDAGPEGLARLRIVGQNKANTIIRLKDNSPGFGAGAEKEVVSFQKKNIGDREGTNVPGSNQLSDITINTGSGNPGAIGALFISANIGEISNVKIKSEDGQGFVGLDMPFFSEQGHYRDITIEGFDNGVRVVSQFATNPTLEYVTLKNQNNAGILVEDGSPCVRRLESTNSVPAVVMTDDQAQVVVVDSELKGGSASNPAIDWQDTASQLFVRNVAISGYGSAINKAGEVAVSGQVSGRVNEYVSDQVYTLFEGVEKKSLNLPIAESLLMDWEQDLSQWANVDDYPGTSDSEKIQNAMNSGKPVVYFPQARYNLTTPVSIPPSVVHVDFMYSRIDNNDQFIISEGSSQTLFLDHGLGRSTLTQSAPRPVVMRNQTMNYTYTSDQPSSLYLESVAGIGASSDFCPSPLSIWGRSVNNENKSTSNFKIFGGTMWVLGYKSEGPQASYEVRDGGKLEVLGGYRNEVLADEGLPIVINDSSDVSFVGYSNLNGSFDLVITETQSGVTQSLLRSEVPGRQSNSVFVPLYVGKAGAAAPACLAPNETGAVPSPTDVQLFWQVRNEGIKNYEVRYRKTGTTAWQITTGSGDTATISELSSGINYEWQVRLQCTEGTSDWSTIGTFTTGIGAKNTPAAPTIDGALNEAEWNLTTAATKIANGSPNNTVTFGLLWDETYLYVGAKVLDNNLFNDSDNVFQDDAVEVFLDVNNNGGAYDFTDNQLIKGYNDTSLFISKAFNGTIAHQVTEINGGYSVELAIPWTGLDVVPSEGLTIGFDVGNDDDDDGGNRDGLLVWSGDSFNFNNTSGFGEVVLLPDAGDANQSPYTTHTLPGIIQAEDYDQGGADIAYVDTDSGNNGGVYRNEDVDIEVSRDTGGGYNVGWMSNGEWLEYTLANVTAGTYDIRFRVASRNTTSNKTLTVELEGKPVGSVSIPATGGWQSWQTVTLPEVSIPGGSNQLLRLTIGGGSFNLNYVDFVLPVSSVADNLSPVADSYVYRKEGNTNYGNDTQMLIKNSPATILNRQSVLKFDLTSFLTIDSAILELECWDKGPTTTDLTVYALEDTWTEIGVTWNNVPSASSAITTTSVVSTGIIRWNLSSYANTQAGQEMSILLNSNQDDALLRLYSKESTTGAAPVLKVYGTQAAYTSVQATEIASFQQGMQRNGRQVGTDRSDPAMALGAPQENDYFNFVSLGFGGSITLKLNRSITNGPGPDLRVVETSFNDANRPCEAYPELADVAVSADGTNYVTVAEAGCKEIEVDLSGSGINEVQYVRITDVSNPNHNAKFGGTADGYDVDGVMQILPASPNGRQADFVARTNRVPDEVSDDLLDLSMYPNPVSDALNIRLSEGEESSVVQVTILDLAGRWVSSDELSLENQRATYQLSHLKPGIYLIRFQTSGQTVTERLIVK